MRKTRLVIAIDGGGIRGILPLMILSQLNRLIIKERLGSCINDRINFAAGTSTGAIIAASMLLKQDGKYAFLPENILNLYVSKGPQLFALDGNGSRKVNALTGILEQTFGSLKLKDISTYFSFVSYDVNSNLPFVFMNRNERYRDVSLAKALAACGAIPGYFSPIEIGNHKLVDGIATNKNPALIAYNNTRQVYPDDCLIMWSFGTGQLTGDYYDDIEHKVDETHKLLTQKANEDRYFEYIRFQPALNHADQAMDNASPQNIQWLMDDAEDYIKTNDQQLKEAIELYKTCRMV